MAVFDNAGRVFGVGGAILATGSLVLTGATLPAATQYASYSQSIASYISGGTAPYTPAYVSGGVNAGYGFSGLNLTVTPNIPFTDNVVLKITDSSSPTQSVTATFSVPVNYVVPAGAQALGYNTLLWMLINPNLTQLNPGPYANTTQNYLYNGYWGISPVPNINLYSMQNGVLQLAQTGSAGIFTMATQNTNGSGPPSANPGLLAYVQNSTGYWVESGMSFSRNGTDLFGSFWLGCAQHNNFSPDQSVNPAQSGLGKQYSEFDIWECGASAGYYGDLIYWQGSSSSNHQNSYTNASLDQTLPHVYGGGYIPSTGGAVWAIDNVQTGTRLITDMGTGPACNTTSLAWINTLKMYANWDTSLHSGSTAYSMNVFYAAAWGP